MESLRVTDDQSKAVQKTLLRIPLDYIKSRMQPEEYIYPEQMPHMTICVVYVDNGFAVVGKSAPADPENFDEALGKKFALEDAIRQLWPLFAFALREGMSGYSVLDDLEEEGDEDEKEE